MARFFRTTGKVTIKTRSRFTLSQLSESVTLVDTVVRATTRTLSDVLTLVDTVLKTTVRILSDAITLANPAVTIAVTFAKVLTETIVLVDTFLSAFTIARVLTETITLVDSVVKATIRSFIEAITLSQIYTNAVTFARRPFMLGTKLLKPLLATLNRKPKTSTKEI